MSDEEMQSIMHVGGLIYFTKIYKQACTTYNNIIRYIAMADAPGKLKRCPRGYKRHRTTRRCVSKSDGSVLAPRNTSYAHVDAVGAVVRSPTKEVEEIVQRVGENKHWLEQLFDVVPAAAPAPGKLKRCPRGYKRHKKTKRCVSKHDGSVLIRTPLGLERTLPPPNLGLERTLAPPTMPRPRTISKLGKLKRCPRGYTRHRRTRKCVSKLDGSELTHTSPKREASPEKEASPSTIVVKSFSPSINRNLSVRNSSSRQQIFGCGLGAVLSRASPQYKKATGPLRVQIGMGQNGPICANWNSKAARNVLLDNLYAESTDCRSVVAPLQKHSNCWFNTMFMVFFASDKGKKFFKFFRAQMIKGVRFQKAETEGAKPKEVRIHPPSLAKAFFLLNAAIEASMDPGATVAKLMDTNNLISMIYSSINRGKTSKLARIKDVRKSANPLTYYTALVEYLGGTLLSHQIRIRTLEAKTLFRPGRDLPRTIIMPHGRPQLPDIAVVEMWDDDAIGKIRDSLQLKSSKAGDGHTYKLDSAIVRDTAQQHFCALLTCGGKPYGFDGSSFSRLGPLNWKPFLQHRSRTWTFEGSVFGTGEQIQWSFGKAYALLFYYRID